MKNETMEKARYKQMCDQLVNDLIDLTHIKYKMEAAVMAQDDGSKEIWITIYPRLDVKMKLVFSEKEAMAVNRQYLVKKKFLKALDEDHGLFRFFLYMRLREDRREYSNAIQQVMLGIDLDLMFMGRQVFPNEFEKYIRIPSYQWIHELFAKVYDDVVQQSHLVCEDHDHSVMVEIIESGQLPEKIYCLTGWNCGPMILSMRILRIIADQYGLEQMILVPFEDRVLIVSDDQTKGVAIAWMLTGEDTQLYRYSHKDQVLVQLKKE